VVVALEVDNKNPIATTLPATLPAYFINSSAFEITRPAKDNEVYVIARYAKDNLLRSGWLRGEDKLKDGIALAVYPMGKGRIVLFGFRPQHRGQTWGTFPFMWNAVNLAARP